MEKGNNGVERKELKYVKKNRKQTWNQANRLLKAKVNAAEIEFFLQFSVDFYWNLVFCPSQWKNDPYAGLCNMKNEIFMQKCP